MKTLLQRHTEFIDSVKARGGKTFIYTAPCCGSGIEDRLASRGEEWDTMARCPHCETTFWKVSTDSTITGELIEK